MANSTELAFLVGLTSIWLPLASRRLRRPATVEAGGMVKSKSAAG